MPAELPLRFVQLLLLMGGWGTELFILLSVQVGADLIFALSGLRDTPSGFVLLMNAVCLGSSLLWLHIMDSYGSRDDPGMLAATAGLFTLLVVVNGGVVLAGVVRAWRSPAAYTFWGDLASDDDSEEEEVSENDSELPAEVEDGVAPESGTVEWAKSQMKGLSAGAKRQAGALDAVVDLLAVKKDEKEKPAAAAGP